MNVTAPTRSEGTDIYIRWQSTTLVMNNGNTWRVMFDTKLAKIDTGQRYVRYERTHY
jgi:hypothetical protein